MDNFSKESSSFSKAISSVKNDNELIGAITIYKQSSEKTIEKMSGLKPSTIFAKTHGVTLGFLKDMSATLGSLSAAIKNSDEKNIQILSSKIIKLATDVQKAQYESHSDGVRAYNYKLKRIQEHRQKLIKEFDKLQSTRYSF
jgi:hypothetical protein